MRCSRSRATAAPDLGNHMASEQHRRSSNTELCEADSGQILGDTPVGLRRCQPQAGIHAVLPKRIHSRPQPYPSWAQQLWCRRPCGGRSWQRYFRDTNVAEQLLATCPGKPTPMEPQSSFQAVRKLPANCREVAQRDEMLSKFGQNWPRLATSWPTPDEVCEIQARFDQTLPVWAKYWPAWAKLRQHMENTEKCWPKLARCWRTSTQLWRSIAWQTPSEVGQMLASIGKDESSLGRNSPLVATVRQLLGNCSCGSSGQLRSSPGSVGVPLQDAWRGTPPLRSGHLQCRRLHNTPAGLRGGWTNGPSGVTHRRWNRKRGGRHIAREHRGHRARRPGRRQRRGRPTRARCRAGAGLGTAGAGEVAALCADAWRGFAVVAASSPAAFAHTLAGSGADMRARRWHATAAR